MPSSSSRAVLTAAIAVLLTLLLVSCSGSGDTSSGEVVTVEIELRDGEVVGGTQRVEVGLDDEVELTITSDVDDEAHVHVYDITIVLRAGEPVTTTFPADIGGMIPVHLHHDGIMLVQLAVA